MRLRDWLTCLVCIAPIGLPSALACDPAGPPPPLLRPDRAAARILSESERVLYGVVTAAPPRDVPYDSVDRHYEIDVLRWFRGTPRPAKLRVRIGEHTCYNPPVAGDKVVLYGGNGSRYLEVAGSHYLTDIPSAETLYPALVELDAVPQAQGQPKPEPAARPWWKLW